MKFRLEHRYSPDPDDVATAYADPGLYAAFAGLPRAGAPAVLDHRGEGDVVELRVRWRFTAPLAPAARRVIDPSKLTWVEESTHDLVRRRVDYVMVPDNYGDRFSCTGRFRFEAEGTGTVRVTEGDLRIKALLVARLVEEAIVSGLEDQLAAEVAIVEAYIQNLA